MLLPLTKGRINSNLMEYLPDDIEAKVEHERLEKIFGKFEPILIILKADDVLAESTLERVKNINDALKESVLVDDVISLFETKYIRGEEGAMLVDPAVDEIPYTDEDREQLREQLVGNPIAYGIVVSEDFRYTTIIVNAAEEVSDEDIIEEIEKIINLNPGPESVYLNGLPYLRYEVQRKATRDLAILFPLGLLIMLLFLYISFREFRGVLLPFSVVLMSIALAMGLMPLLGWDFSLLAVLVPIMMIAIANNYGVHIVARYQELNAKQPQWSMREIIDECLVQLSKPIILTGLTTIVGVIGLVAHLLLPAKQIGIVSSIAIGFALALSLLFIPSIMIRMKKGKPIAIYTTTKKTMLDKILAWSARASTQTPKAVILVFSLVVLIAGIGISKLKVSINLEQMMPRKHQLRISTDIANEYFGGTKIINVLYEGDIMDPKVMGAMDKLETDLKSVEGVGSATSIATVTRIISRALNDEGDELYDRIPDDRQTIAQYIEFYNMSGDPEDFESMVNFDYTQAQVTIQFSAVDIGQFNRIESTIRELASRSEYAKAVAGQCLVEKQISNSIVTGQIYSLIFALLAIAIMLWAIFRSATAGLLSSIPLFASLICNFGLMGWFGFPLDIGNSLLSSIAIGIGVDYTIHLFWRLKYELSLGNKYSDAITRTLTNTGRGIAINAFSVIIGFAVLFLSGMVILQTFAFLIIFSLLICLMCALVLIPAISMLAKPGFLERNGRTSIKY
jgi:hypothetical protein